MSLLARAPQLVATRGRAAVTALSGGLGLGWLSSSDTPGGLDDLDKVVYAVLAGAALIAIGQVLDVTKEV